MNQELQNKLYEKYPKIFGQKDLPMTQTAMCWGISCGDGWYNIIDTLCGHLQYLVDHPHEEIEMYEGWIQKELALPENEQRESWIQSCKEYIEKQKSQIIPQLEASQVKEKYGGLRFYLSGYPIQSEIDAKVTAYINFAEAMSYVTCEDCGAPGKQQGKHWVSTICDSCKQIRENERQQRIDESYQLNLDFK